MCSGPAAAATLAIVLLSRASECDCVSGCKQVQSEPRVILPVLSLSLKEYIYINVYKNPLNCGVVVEQRVSQCANDSGDSQRVRQ